MKYVAVLFLLLFAAHAEAATYWVSKSGNDSNGCFNSVSQPNLATQSRLTINAGLNCLTGGDTLIVGNGTYTNAIRQSGWPSGNGSIYTVVQAQNNKQVIISGFNFAFYNADSHHIRIDGLVLDGVAICLGCNGSHHVEFINGEIKNAPTGQNGVFSEGSAFNATGDFNALRNNLIHDNALNDPGQAHHNVYWNSSYGTIEGNDIYNAFGWGVQIQYSSAHHNTIRNNRVHDNPNRGGIVLSSFDTTPAGTPGSHDNYVYNNLIWNTVSSDGGISISHGGSNPSNDNVVVNNTLYNNYVNIAVDSGTGNIVRNNILYQNTAADFINNGGSVTASNNLCTTTCSFGSSNQSGNPNFVSTNPSSTDFLKLPSGASPAKDNGLNLGAPYNTDYSGASRPASGAWDIGAYEYAAVSGPVVTITGPTSNPTFTTTSPTINLSGTSTQTGGTIAYSCDRCGSGSMAGVSSWTFLNIALKPGVNVFTVTGTDSSGTGSDQITVTYAPPPPGNTLAGAWGFENNANDSSGNSNNGTVLNSAPFITDGHSGSTYALSLNGTNQAVNVPDSTSLAYTQPFTFSAWVKPTAVSTVNKAVMVKNYVIALYASQDGTYCTAGGPVIWFNTNGSSGPAYYACYSTPLAVNNWSHLAATYDGASLKLYVNGVVQASSIATGYMEPTSGALQIGRSQFGEFFQGEIDEARTYNWAIPATAGGNTTFNTACAATDEINTPSIIGDANCPVIPLAPPLTFWIGASSTFEIGAGATFQIGAAP